MFNRETGAKEAMTYRCADMDRMVPNLMGVSKVGVGGWGGGVWRRRGWCMDGGPAWVQRRWF